MSQPACDQTGAAPSVRILFCYVNFKAPPTEIKTCLPNYFMVHAFLVISGGYEVKISQQQSNIHPAVFLSYT